MTNSLTNPVFAAGYNVRDPAVERLPTGYRIYFSKFLRGEWNVPSNWSVACVRTADFANYEEEGDLTPSGFASPDNPVEWGGRHLLAYQSYPAKPVRLCYSVRGEDGRWSRATPFLQEAAALPWNTERRVIDPTLIVDGTTLHCFFTGTATACGVRANLIGHATTTDPAMKSWSITTVDRPLIGISHDAPDGAENVTIFRVGGEWRMIYSEGLAHQHLAAASSPDLVHWNVLGKLAIPPQSWMRVKHGAPVVWQEHGRYRMLLMGEDAARHTTLGLLESADAVHWTSLPERRSPSQ